MNKRNLFVISLIIIFWLCFFTGLKKISENFGRKSFEKHNCTEEAISMLPRSDSDSEEQKELPGSGEKEQIGEAQVISGKDCKKEENMQTYDSQHQELNAFQLNRQAQELEETGDSEGAITKYKQAIELNPRLDSAYSNLGNLYCKKGNYELAVENLEKALKLKRRAAYYSNLGNVYYRKGEYSRAILEYEKALKVEPEEAYIYNNLGDAYLKKGSMLIAIKYLKKAIFLKPDYFLAYKNLIEAYHLREEYQQIEEILHKAMRNNSEEFFFCFELAKLYEQQGKYEEELNLLKEYLIFNPGNKFIEAKIETLQKMVYK